MWRWARLPSESGRSPLAHGEWPRCGTTPWRRKPGLPVPRPAKENAEARARADLTLPAKANPQESSQFPFVVVQQAAQFIYFLFGSLAVSEGMHHQLAR